MAAKWRLLRVPNGFIFVHYGYPGSHFRGWADGWCPRDGYEFLEYLNGR